jgi:hypothetical protein
MLRKPSIAYRVALVGRMLAAVDFDDQPLLSADKVNDVRPDGLLTDELVAARLRERSWRQRRSSAFVEFVRS